MLCMCVLGYFIQYTYNRQWSRVFIDSPDQKREGGGDAIQESSTIIISFTSKNCLTRPFVLKDSWEHFASNPMYGVVTVPISNTILSNDGSRNLSWGGLKKIRLG